MPRPGQAACTTPYPNPSNWGQIHQARTGHCQPLSTAQQPSSSSAAFSKCWSHKSGHHLCNIGSPNWCPHYCSRCQKRERQNKLWSYLCNSAPRQSHDPTYLSLPFLPLYLRLLLSILSPPMDGTLPTRRAEQPTFCVGTTYTTADLKTLPHFLHVQ